MPSRDTGDTHARAQSAARAAAKAAEIARLVVEVLLEQAEKRTPFPNPALLEARVAESGIAKTDAETPYGNALVALERGAQGEPEKQIVAAFFGIGIRALLDSVSEADRATEVRRLLPALDWLHAWSGLDCYGAVDDALGTDLAQAFWEACVDELSSGSAPSNAILAERLLRVEALRSSNGPEREAWLARTSQSASDIAVRAHAGAGSGGGEGADGSATSAEPGIPQLTGRYGGRPPTPLRRLLALGTGFAALAGIASLLGRVLLGFRRTATVTLVHRGIRVERRVALLGRTIRKSEEVVPFASLALVARETRFPYLYLLVGAAGMVLGAMWGVFRVVDSIRGSYAPLAIVGLLAIAVGVAFDLSLYSFWPWRRGRTQVHVLRRPKRWLRILDVSETDAHRMLAAVTDRLRAVR